jgi:hypothetical protein
VESEIDCELTHTMRVPTRVGAMHYTFTTPPASRVAERPIPIDDALVAEARRQLMAAVRSLPPAVLINRRGMQALFAGPMAALCRTSAPTVPIEKLIIAIKLAWASMSEARLSLGDAGGDALSGAVTACIEAYFHPGSGSRAD